MNNNKTHNKYSPSKYPAWAECVHYEPSNSSNTSSDAGTQAHKELEQELNGTGDSTSRSVLWARDKILELADGVSVLTEQALCSTVLSMEITGTADIIFEDADGVVHIGDFKTFSDGTKNYMLQLKGYATLFMRDKDKLSDKVILHIFHGASFIVETLETTFEKCVKSTEAILTAVKNKDGDKCLCGWCQYCANISSCPVASGALEAVDDSCALQFSQMSLPQKLVVLDVVDKLSATIREQAKAEAIANGGVLEADGIRYEMKPWAGRSKVRSICELAGAIQAPEIDTEQGVIKLKGVSPDVFINCCDVSKTKAIEVLKEANPKIKKIQLEKWVSSYFDKQEGGQRFVRTK